MSKFTKAIKNKKFLLAVFTGLIFLFFVFMGFFAPVNRGSEKIIKIEKGWGSGEVAQELKDNGLIKSKWLFVFYVWARGYNRHLQAGEYALSPKMSPFEISNIIAKGEIALNVVKATIPEGWTVKQINERLMSLAYWACRIRFYKTKKDTFSPIPIIFIKIPLSKTWSRE